MNEMCFCQSSIVNYCLEHPENWGEDLSKEEAEVKFKAYISSLGRWKQHV